MPEGTTRVAGWGIARYLTQQNQRKRFAGTTFTTETLLHSLLIVSFDSTVVVSISTASLKASRYLGGRLLTHSGQGTKCTYFAKVNKYGNMDHSTRNTNSSRAGGLYIMRRARRMTFELPNWKSALNRHHTVQSLPCVKPQIRTMFYGDRVAVAGRRSA